MEFVFVFMIIIAFAYIIYGIYVLNNPKAISDVSLRKKDYLEEGQYTDRYYKAQEKWGILRIISGVAIIIIVFCFIKPSSLSFNFGGTSTSGYTIMVNSNQLSIPCTYSELEAIGFSLDADEKSIILQPGGRGYYYVWNTSYHRMGIAFENTTNTEKALTECEVVKIDIDKMFCPEFALSNGVKKGMKRKDAEALLGTERVNGFDVRKGGKTYHIHIGYDGKDSSDIVCEISVSLDS